MRKEIVLSDLSGREIDSDEVARITVSDHPALGNRTVELDAAVEEVEGLESSKITLVSVGIHLPGQAGTRRVVLEVGAFNRLFGEQDVDQVLRNARPGGASGGSGGSGSSRPRRAARASSGGSKVDYRDESRFGLLHRGRVTEEEAAMVRANLVQANRNRVAAGQPEIDPSDPREKKRYGF